MRKRMMLQASSAVAATVVLGSVLSGTAFAATTANNHPATHAPIGVSYVHSVLVLINQLENNISQSRLKSTIDSEQNVVKIGHGPMNPASGSQVNPGGPMIPASGSQVNPGGPMIPASGSKVNPGGPMIPASGSKVNPGGPMIPASGSQVNPGGPMIPASGSQVNPGGPMIPASPSNVTDKTVYQQLVSATNLFTQMLRTDEMDGNSNTVIADRSQANRVLRALKSTFLNSTQGSKDTSSSSFTPAELSSAHCATQFFLDMMKS